MNDFNDDDIALAIALSLKDAGPPKAPRKPVAAEVIEIESDSDDGEPNHKKVHLSEDAQFEVQMRHAMQLSKMDSGPSSATSSRPTSTPPAQPSQTQPMSMILSDRKKLEAERLARLKRLRPDIAQAQESRGGASDEDDEDVDERAGDRTAKRQRLLSALPSSHRTNAASSSTRVNANPTASGSKTGQDGFFWEGELRQTANRHVDRDKDTRPVFRLSEIIGPKEDISFAILSAYVVEQAWIYEFFKIRTPLILVAHDVQGNATMKEILPEWIRTTPQLAGGRGCMHMKFMLIFYRTGRLRVMVSTANLIRYDWSDIENTVWVQDFPLRPSPIPHDSKADDFPTTFSRILRSVNVVPALLQMGRNGHDDLPLKRVEDLRCKWDFSKAKVYLIPSIAGRHEGWPKVIQTGHTSLMKALRDMGACTGQSRDLTLECQGSSIGTYSTQWMNEFYCSARGDSAESWLDQPKTRRSKLPYPPIKILFPSTKTVRESVLGEQGGGTMFCRRAQWQAAKFPRDLFHDSNSKRGGVLMHSKMVVGIFKGGAFASSSGLAGKRSSRTDSFDSGDDEDIVEVSPQVQEDLYGWVYVGSHNFTPSAWGNLSGSAFNPVMNVTNFELGIAFPLRSEEELEEVACWKRPARKYVIGKDEPWMQSESAHFIE